MAEEAAELGLEALAITDHHGFYGVVRFAEAARWVSPVCSGQRSPSGLQSRDRGQPIRTDAIW
ncbi:MAG: PHP domain-containing protein [Microthrixaceae bacterium]